MGAIGPEAYVSGAQAAGRDVDANRIYAYDNKQKYLDIDLRTDARNLKASQIAVEGTQAAGGYADPSLYAGVESNLRDKIADLTRKLGEEIKLAGEHSEGAATLRNDIAEAYAHIGANAKQAAQATLGYEQSVNSIGAANTGYAGAAAALYGGAGSFGRWFPNSRGILTIKSAACKSTRAVCPKARNATTRWRLFAACKRSG